MPQGFRGILNAIDPTISDELVGLLGRGLASMGYQVPPETLSQMVQQNPQGAEEIIASLTQGVAPDAGPMKASGKFLHGLRSFQVSQARPVMGARRASSSFAGAYAQRPKTSTKAAGGLGSAAEAYARTGVGGRPTAPRGGWQAGKQPGPVVARPVTNIAANAATAGAGAAGLGALGEAAAKALPAVGLLFMASQLGGQIGDFYLRNKQINEEKKARKNEALANAMLIANEANRESEERAMSKQEQREQRDFMEKMMRRQGNQDFLRTLAMSGASNGAENWNPTDPRQLRAISEADAARLLGESAPQGFLASLGIR